MTAPDELQRAVERLSLAPGRMEPRTGFYTSMVRLDDLQLLLSERAELLATVERMRGGLKKITTNYGPRHLAHQIARAALTTGEATNAGERG